MIRYGKKKTSMRRASVRRFNCRRFNEHNKILVYVEEETDIFYWFKMILEVRYDNGKMYLTNAFKIYLDFLSFTVRIVRECVNCQVSQIVEGNKNTDLLPYDLICYLEMHYDNYESFIFVSMCVISDKNLFHLRARVDDNIFLNHLFKKMTNTFNINSRKVWIKFLFKQVISAIFAVFLLVF